MMFLPPSRTDILLLALDRAGAPGLSPVQLQKVLFVAGDRIAHSVGQDFYRFVPHHYGPFSKEVFMDVDGLMADGLVHQTHVHGGLRKYFLTDKGRSVVSMNRYDSQLEHYVEELVDWSQRLSFNELVRAIYEEYPDMQVNSVFSS